VFGDYWNKRLICHEECGKYDGEFKYYEPVNTITCVDHAKIAVERGYNESYVDIINTGVKLKEKTIPFALTVRIINVISKNFESLDNFRVFRGNRASYFTVNVGYVDIFTDGIKIELLLMEIHSTNC
jgi:hypothetical protein